ncbi:MAG: endonuclease/exonuclease/phosphatase family protein [Gammaproteobacteria bacterium]
MNLQILSYNIHKGIGWSIIPTTIYHIQSRIQEINSDIIFLQEVRGIQCDLLRSELSPHFAYGKNATYRKGHHGNAILSKFPIVFSENIDLSMHRFERRGVLHSIIKLDEKNQPIHLLCTHLGLFSKDRRKQLDIIVKYINDNIPEHEPVILGGDFNDWTGYATEPLIQNLEFQEAFLNIHTSYAKTFPAWVPILKLDRMYYRGFNVNYANRLIHKPWRYLSDHIAIEVSLNLVI